jgi:hypothetical protein
VEAIPKRARPGESFPQVLAPGWQRSQKRLARLGRYAGWYQILDLDIG